MSNNNAGVYMLQRYKLNLLLKMYAKLPHIASQVTVKIRPATLNDYYFTKEFRDFAIMVELTFGKDGCEKCRCNPVFPRKKKCTIINSTLLFKSGNNEHTACEPACFSLYNENYMPFVRWSKKFTACLNDDIQHYRYGVDDTIRQDPERVIPWVNNIGTGFDSTIDYDTDGYEYRRFKINKQYCKALCLSYDHVNNKCYESNIQSGIKFFISDSLYRFSGLAVDLITEGKNSLDVRLNENEIITDPKNIPRLFLEWENNSGRVPINPNIKLSELGFNKYRIDDLNYKTEYIWTNESESLPSIVNYLDTYPETVFYDAQLNTLAEKFFKIDKRTGMRVVSLDRHYYRLENYVLNFNSQIATEVDEETNTTEEQKRNKLKEMLSNIWSVESLKNLAIMGLSEATILIIQKQLEQASLKSIPLIVNNLSSKLIKLPLNKLPNVIKPIVTRQMLTMSLKTIGKGLAKSALVASKALTLAGLITIPFDLADIAFTFLDPFNVEREIDDEMLKYLGLSVLDNNKINYGEKNYELTPLMLMLQLLEGDETITQDELNKLQISFKCKSMNAFEMDNITDYIMTMPDESIQYLLEASNHTKIMDEFIYSNKGTEEIINNNEKTLLKKNDINTSYIQVILLGLYLIDIKKIRELTLLKICYIIVLVISLYIYMYRACLRISNHTGFVYKHGLNVNNN